LTFLGGGPGENSAKRRTGCIENAVLWERQISTVNADGHKILKALQKNCKTSRTGDEQKAEDEI